MDIKDADVRQIEALKRDLQEILDRFSSSQLQSMSRALTTLSMAAIVDRRKNLVGILGPAAGCVMLEALSRYEQEKNDVIDGVVEDGGMDVDGDVLDTAEMGGI